MNYRILLLLFAHFLCDPYYAYAQESYLKIIDLDDESSSGYVASMYELKDSLVTLILEGDRIFVSIHESDNGHILSQYSMDSLSCGSAIDEPDKRRFVCLGYIRQDTWKNAIIVLGATQVEYAKAVDYAGTDDSYLPTGFRATPTGYMAIGRAQTEWKGVISIFDADHNMVSSEFLENYANVERLVVDQYGNGYCLGYENYVPSGIPIDTTAILIKFDPEGKIISETVVEQGTAHVGTNYLGIDTTHNRLYYHDEHGDNGDRYARLVMMDYDGNVSWAKKAANTVPNMPGYLRITADGDIYSFRAGQSISNPEALPHSAGTVKKIDKDGDIVWERAYYYMEGDSAAVLHTGVHDFGSFWSTDDHLYMGGSLLVPYLNTVTKKPFYVKLSKEGNYQGDTSYLQNLGDPFPIETMVTPRNVYHIYNRETQESYRYTWHRRQDLTGRSGELLRHDEMQGDVGWQKTGRLFRSDGRAVDPFTTTFSLQKFVKERFAFPPIGDDLPPFHPREFHYLFGMAIGETMELYNPSMEPFFYTELVAVAADTITFRDGRERRRITLECTETSAAADAADAGTHVWIEDIGNPDDFLNTLGACYTPGSEVVTCYFSNGELVWTHPDYDGCTVSTSDAVTESTSVTISPNPAVESIYLPITLVEYQIVDVRGAVVLTGENVGAGQSIEISGLPTGMYYLQGTADDDSVVSSRFIKS